MKESSVRFCDYCKRVVSEDEIDTLDNGCEPPSDIHIACGWDALLPVVQTPRSEDCNVEVL